MNLRHLRQPPGAAVAFSISYWLFFPRAWRPSTAALGLSSYSCKQRIDFCIIQPLQRSGQVLGQEMARLRGQIVRSGFVLWNSRRFCRRRCRWSRKQVRCCLCRPPNWHATNYAAGVSPRQRALRRWAGFVARNHADRSECSLGGSKRIAAPKPTAWKVGLEVMSEKDDKRGRVYRIAGEAGRSRRCEWLRRFP